MKKMGEEQFVLHRWKMLKYNEYRICQWKKYTKNQIIKTCKVAMFMLGSKTRFKCIGTSVCIIGKP